jgi:hypothetical protein
MVDSTIEGEYITSSEAAKEVVLNRNFVCGSHFRKKCTKAFGLLL